ncbi:hypothetical protein BOX15_Mlig010335g2, partial [Macrostomum lignano]
IIVKMVLTTFHGNAAVERGFSVNKECLEPNLQGLSIRSLRLVYEWQKGKTAAEIIAKVTEEMLKSVRSARSRYRAMLEQQRAEASHRKYEESRKRKDATVLELQSKQKKLLLDVAVLTKDADSLVYQCETDSNMSLLVKSNALRRAAQQKKEEVEKVEKEIVALEGTIPH